MLKTKRMNPVDRMRAIRKKKEELRAYKQEVILIDSILFNRTHVSKSPATKLKTLLIERYEAVRLKEGVEMEISKLQHK